MESINMSRPALPPIKYLDSDKFKREEVDYQSRTTTTSAHNLNATSAASPTFQHPTGPPPPYSNLPPPPHVSTHHLASASHPLHPRSQDGEEKDQRQQQTRQFLPSLQEALGVEQPLPYKPESAYSSSHANHIPLVTSSPTMSSRTPHTMDPPTGPHHAFGHTATSASHAPQARNSVIHSPREPPERRQSDSIDYPGYHPRTSQVERPAYSPRSTQYHAQAHSYPHPDTVSAYENAPPVPAPAASQNLAYGYAPYPPRFAATNPSTKLPPSIYQPSVTQPPPTQGSSTWRADGPSTASTDAVRDSVGASRPYGESVKRHLDLYDFESALNELAENSTITLDFSRQYGARLHQTQRSGPVPGTLPAITEIDDLMNKSRGTLEALNRMREVLVAQQAVYYQQAQEQQMKTESEGKRNDSVHHAEDLKNGSFTGGECKKRRGRAAAPGRCHSCNRAETPEWRRGPDGARTLCNACGLHYAKLTRKAGAHKAAVAGSNLRPKSRERDATDT